VLAPLGLNFLYMTHLLSQFFRQNVRVVGSCLVVCALAVTGCIDGEGIKQEIGRPVAKGRTGEIIVVVDSAKWAGPVGEAMRLAIAPPVPGLLGEEPSFTMRHVNPYQFNDLLRRHKNIIFLAPLEGTSASTQRMKQFFTKESLERIAKDDSTYMLVKQNEFAMGQTVLFLFGKTDNILIHNIKQHQAKLGAIFNEVEIRRMTQTYLKMRAENGSLDGNILKTHRVSISLPVGYKFVMEKVFGNGEAGFVWVRAPDYEIDRNVFLAYKPYLSEKQFDQDSILAWRNQLCQSYIFGDPGKKQSYLITEQLVPPTFQVSKVGTRYAVEMRGLWRTNEQVVMGGTFLSYVFADPDKGRIYYAEGFLYAPAKNYKRELMREFEVVLKNIK